MDKINLRKLNIRKTQFIIATVYSVSFILWFLLFITLLDTTMAGKVLPNVGVLLITIPSHLVFFSTLLYLSRLITLYQNKGMIVEADMLSLAVNQKRHELYRFLSLYLVKKEVRSQQVISDVFDHLFETIDSSDLGSVLILESDHVHFEKVKGYDLDTLNNLKMDPAEFELNTFGLRKNLNAEYSLKHRMAKNDYDTYRSSSPEIIESIYIGLVNEEGKRMGIALDMSVEQHRKLGRGFLPSEVEVLKEAQVLITAVFKMKNIVVVRDELQKDVVTAFIAALEQHDIYTKGHSEAVAKLSLDIGRQLALNEEGLRELEWAAMIHDIGKVVIPSVILNKKGRLTTEEYETIKLHPVNGARFLEKMDSLRDISRFVRHHHERYDGLGYPDGLKANDIPLCARIISVADAYHAMTSDRPYKVGMTLSKARDEVIANKGTQFCPVIVDAFIAALG